jgi:predicted ester cyclase
VAAIRVRESAVKLGSSVVAAEETVESMTVEQTQTTLDAYLDALVGGGLYADYFADDIVVTMMDSGQETVGREAAAQAIGYLHEVAFTAKPELKALIVGEGQAALEAVFVATHTGEFAGIAPTGKEVRLPYSVFYELENGKITALRLYFPIDLIVKQLTVQ